MEPNVQATEAEVTQKTSNLSTESSGALSPATSPSSEQPWREWLDPASDFLSKLPDFVGKFVADYRQPLVTLGLIVLGAIGVKLTLALLSAINDVPFMSPLFELVGIGYTGWFIYRYLLQSKTREELMNEFKTLKSEIIGSVDGKKG